MGWNNARRGGSTLLFPDQVTFNTLLRDVPAAGLGANAWSIAAAPKRGAARAAGLGANACFNHICLRAPAHGRKYEQQDIKVSTAG